VIAAELDTGPSGRSRRSPDAAHSSSRYGYFSRYDFSHASAFFRSSLFGAFSAFSISMAFHCSAPAISKSPTSSASTPRRSADSRLGVAAVRQRLTHFSRQSRQTTQSRSDGHTPYMSFQFLDHTRLDTHHTWNRLGKALPSFCWSPLSRQNQRTVLANLASFVKTD